MWEILKKLFSFEPHFLTARKFLTGFQPISMELAKISFATRKAYFPANLM